MKKIKILTIGGGKGQSCVLRGLVDYDDLEITSIVSMFDSGGGSGVLRKAWNVLPPGDVLKNILALSPNRDKLERFLQHRFETDNSLNSNSPGNFLLASMAKYSNDYYQAVQALSGVMKTKGTVLPITESKATLVALLTDSEEIRGESKIDAMEDDKRAVIEKIRLEPEVDSEKIIPGKGILKSIDEADYIILSPGDLYTSLLPNLIVPGIRKAFQKSSAKLVYVVNIATKKGETDSYKGEQFAELIEKYAGRKIDIIIVNKNKLAEKEYSKLGISSVGIEKGFKKAKVIEGDFVNDCDIIKYDSNKIGKVIHNTIKC